MPTVLTPLYASEWFMITRKATKTSFVTKNIIDQIKSPLILRRSSMNIKEERDVTTESCCK